MEDLKKIEEEVLKWWQENEIFEKGQERRKPHGWRGKRFVFFEGPPGTNGRPGMHHFIGRAFKDLFCRYKTMRGFYVERKSGWDTHGLPVEIEVEKTLGLKSKKDIEAYGIDKFNHQARKSVWKYKDEWERFTKRIGFWLDLKNPYITYESKYIESLWWVLKKIWDKKLLFRGHKVVPFCTRCGTPLSSHEVAQGYRNVSDNSVYVKFKLKPGQNLAGQIVDDNTYFLSWTTTPWTLPGNVALAVGDKIGYLKIKPKGGNESYILAKGTLLKVFPNFDGMELSFVDGRDLAGLEYEPLFNIEKLKSEKSYKIYPADFVNTSEGTGIVHTAVMYGEDDYALGLKVGLPRHHTVDENGNFTKDVPELQGNYVKDPDTEKAIIAHLKARNLLLKEEPYLHDYPFCWRCGTALIYYATNSWFIGMSKLEKQLRKNNQKINWHPQHLKEGRFGEWLRGIKDWAISRDRYWGTPLPIWHCKKCKADHAVGSLEELETLRYRGRNTFFLMRHGHSTKNGLNDGPKKDQTGTAIISSKLDKDKYGLTEDGKKTIAEEVEALKKIGGVDIVVSSPFLRTRETAEIVAKKFGLKYEIDERFKELDHGSSCEGMPQNACSMENVGRTMDNAEHEDGEIWRTAKKRMWSALRDLEQKYENKKIVVVSHGDPLWLLESAMLGLSDEETVAYRDGAYPLQGKFRKVELKNLPHNEEGVLDMHRPYIDEITLKCGKCHGKMSRIKEVADVWFDSGAMPYAQWHYPFEGKKNFKNNFPAEFISEGIDQTRGWFYTLLAVSTLLDKDPAYKNVLSYGLVLDEKGQKMSKSKGNVADPFVVVENSGADAARWYFYTVNEPGEPKLFSLNDVALRYRGFVMTLWNSYRFFELYNPGDQIFVGNFHKNLPKSKLDRWVLSRLNGVVRTATGSLDEYDPTTASRAIGHFVVEDFSKWWLRRSRSRFQKPESEAELVSALSFLRFLLLEIAKIIAPFTPFLAEKIHWGLHKGTPQANSSVHWHNWPKANNKFIDEKLEQAMAAARNFVTLGLAQRKDGQLKVRQPLSKVTLKLKDRFDAELEELIKDELNVKNTRYESEQIEEVVLDRNLTQELIWEGWAREMVRQIQDMRKEAGYKFNDKVTAQWHSEDEELKKATGQWSDFVRQNSLLKEFSEAQHTGGPHFDIQKEFELSPQKRIWLGVEK